MANEDKKDFNAMLHKDAGMPKMQIITDEDQILYPTALSFLSSDEWKTVRTKGASVGYAWTQKDGKDENLRSAWPYA